MLQPMNIVLTGASGFIGTELIDGFLHEGWHVMALVRGAKNKPKRDGVKYVEYDLSKQIDTNYLKAANCVVHAAYIKHSMQGSDALNLNVEGARYLLQASNLAGIRKNIFISSMSAHKNATSVYGRQKLSIENLFTGPNDAIIRPGLVIGDGGIVKIMIKLMQRTHVVPLVGNGRQSVQIIDVSDLVSATINVIKEDLKGVFTVANNQPCTYKEFYQCISRVLKIKVVFLHVPDYLFRLILLVIEAFNVPLGITTDNLDGLKRLEYSPTTHDLSRLRINPLSLSESLIKLETIKAI